jgi:hypothetical protein
VAPPRELLCSQACMSAVTCHFGSFFVDQPVTVTVLLFPWVR